MKKLLCAVLCAVLLVPESVLGAADEINKLTFKPVGEGKFIYCNNPEELTRDDLADDGEFPSYLMNNEALTKGKYRLYFSHFNRVKKQAEDGTLYPGENIYIDAVVTAKSDCRLRIDKTVFEVPSNNTTYLDYETINTEDSWSSMYACADLLGTSITTLNTGKTFNAHTQDAKYCELKKGDSVFLSSFFDNYSSVPYPKHVLMASDLEILDGKCDINVFAARMREVNGDVITYPKVNFENLGYGIYKSGRTQKGIANSLPEMAVSLSYTIDDSTKDGTLLPVTVYNQYYPKGSPVLEWVTNLNPQDDTYSRNLVCEDCVLPFTYRDESKKTYYGDAVSDLERDDVWIFDTRHSDTAAYTEGTGFTKSDYVPNYELETGKSNIGYACSLGNYGVTLRYNMTVTNNGECDRYLNYNVSTAANVIVETKAADGTYLCPVISRGQTNDISKDVLSCVRLPKGETTQFSLGLTLPVQNYGGQRQSFSITSKNTDIKTQENVQIKPVLYEENILDKYQIPKLLKNADKKTQTVFSGELDSFCIVKTGSGFAAYHKAAEGNPYYYGYFWEITGKLFLLDSKFNITKELYLGSQPIEMRYTAENLYVKTIANGSFKIDSSGDYEEFSGYILPYGLKDITVLPENGNVKVSVKDDDYYGVEFVGTAPPFINTNGEFLYFATQNELGVSSDGIYWNIKKLPEPTDSLNIIKNGVSANGIEVVCYDKAIPKVRVNNEFLSFDAPVIISGDNTLVPLRTIFEKLGIKVLYNAEKSRITVIGANSVSEFTPGSNIAMVNGEERQLLVPVEIHNGTTYIPLRFISENLEYNVAWDDENNIAVITGEIIPVTAEYEVYGDISVK